MFYWTNTMPSLRCSSVSLPSFKQPFVRLITDDCKSYFPHLSIMMPHFPNLNFKIPFFPEGKKWWTALWYTYGKEKEAFWGSGLWWPQSWAREHSPPQSSSFLPCSSCKGPSLILRMSLCTTNSSGVSDAMFPRTQFEKYSSWSWAAGRLLGSKNKAR